MILMKKLTNLTFLVLALGISYANADDSWRKEFGDLSARGEFDQALELLNQPELADDLEAAQHRGFLYGSGQLSKGVDRCAAVFNLETAYEAGFYFVRGALDYLYGGDWAGIAALEGSRSALFIVGQRIYESDGRSRVGTQLAHQTIAEAMKTPERKISARLS